MVRKYKYKVSRKSISFAFVSILWVFFSIERFVSAGREPTTSPSSYRLRSEGKKRDERIRTSQRRSTFVQGDFQLSGISRWNASKAKSQWSPIDFCEDRWMKGRKKKKEKRNEEKAWRERRSKRRRRSSDARVTDERPRKSREAVSKRRIFNLDEAFTTRRIRGTRKKHAIGLLSLLHER